MLEMSHPVYPSSAVSQPYSLSLPSIVPEDLQTAFESLFTIRQSQDIEADLNVHEDSDAFILPKLSVFHLLV